ncbi:LacI family DNA-binding transcriptional regulator [Acidithiobacillus sp. M4-SHS-6]|uniref:LacI family DNA-binding transcriptional regulator n=1 Tax=Acidithiobacillus sp. M4-SHS-6 TaxID=3383024 RepID=UPI0039BE4BE0
MKSIPVTARISDVARKAEVSTATVSRFLRGDRVRNVERIVQAIEALDYRPVIAAQSLRSGIHYAVAMVVPDITNPYFAALAKGVESVFRDTDYRLFLANTDESSKIEDAVLKDVSSRVDGIILVPALEQDELPLRLRRAGIPIVLVDRELTEKAFESVLVDNLGGAAAAARYFIELGHTAIAMISGPLGNTPGRARYEGFLAALAEVGIRPPPEYLEVADFREAGGYQAMLRLLDLPEPPTAVFCANNVMTVGGLKALAANRVRVPRDISLIGFDDLELGMLLHPPLTVIDRPTEEQGVLAGQLILRHLQGKQNVGVPNHVVMPTKLIVRGSCGTPRNGPQSQRRST